MTLAGFLILPRQASFHLVIIIGQKPGSIYRMPPVCSAQLTEKHRRRRLTVVIQPPSAEINSGVAALCGRTIASQPAGKSVSGHGEGCGRRSWQRIREERRVPRSTLSSRVTGTRRESAYNERTLSVCARFVTCRRVFIRVCALAFSARIDDDDDATRRDAERRLKRAGILPRAVLLLSSSRIAAVCAVAWHMSADGWVSTRVCPSGRKRPFRGRVQKGVAQGLDAAPCAPFLISN